MDANIFKSRKFWHVARVSGYIFALLVLAVLIVEVAFSVYKRPLDQMVWGLTYSAPYARSLGLDSQDAYRHILDDLQPKQLRLVAYWNDIEPKPNQWDFSDLDFQVAGAEQRQIPYTIVIGRRVLRYPECYAPSWVEQQPVDQQFQALEQYLRTVVKRYDDQPHLAAWQVENELEIGSGFGQCPGFHNIKDLGPEVRLVRSMSEHDIQITDGGFSWPLGFGDSDYADVFGTSLYRTEFVGGLPISKPLMPGFYNLRAKLIKIFEPRVKKVIISELQMEPWSQDDITKQSQAYYDKTLSLADFHRHVSYAQRTDIKGVYMWGAEWWYYMKTDRHNDSYWLAAMQVFARSGNP